VSTHEILPSKKKYAIVATRMKDGISYAHAHPARLDY